MLQDSLELSEEQVNEFKEYWNQRKYLVVVLNYLAGMENKSDSWNKCGKTARLVAGAVENDHT